MPVVGVVALVALASTIGFLFLLLSFLKKRSVHLSSAMGMEGAGFVFMTFPSVAVCVGAALGIYAAWQTLPAVVAIPILILGSLIAIALGALIQWRIVKSVEPK